MLTLVRTSVPTMEARKYNVGKGKKEKNSYGEKWEHQNELVVSRMCTCIILEIINQFLCIYIPPFEPRSNDTPKTVSTFSAQIFGFSPKWNWGSSEKWIILELG